MDRSPNPTSERLVPGRPFRLVAAVLLLALLVGQWMALLSSVAGREARGLGELRTEAATLVAVLNQLASAGVAPADFSAMAEQVMPVTRLRGGTILSEHDQVLETFGETPELLVNTAFPAGPNAIVASAAYASRYDVAWRLSDVGGAYFIVLRMDSTGIEVAAANAPHRLMTGILTAFLFAAIALLAMSCGAVTGPLTVVQDALRAGDAALLGAVSQSGETELVAIARSARRHLESMPGNGEPVGRLPMAEAQNLRA